MSWTWASRSSVRVTRWPPRPPTPVSAADADGDGNITMKEMEQHVAKKTDTDGDGVISAEEAAAARKRGDALVAMRARMAQKMLEGDALANGSFKPPPFGNPDLKVEYLDSLGNRRSGNAMPHSTEMGIRCARCYLLNPNNAMLLPGIQALADDDGSGTIDKAEFLTLLAASGAGKDADAAALFREADLDGDGQLSMEEMQALGRKPTIGRG